MRTRSASGFERWWRRGLDKELVGDFKNGAREWRAKASPELVRTPNLEDKELGKAMPTASDLASDEG
jgi:hypothetical protein